MKRVIKNVLRFLVIGSSTLLLAACYGVMTGFQFIKVTVRDTTTNSGIPGLKVTLIENGQDAGWNYTDSAGTTGLRSFTDASGTSDLQVRIEDTDGSDNGSYAAATRDLEGNELCVSLP